MLSYSRIILENKEGNVLLHLRKNRSIQGGRWSLFGGRIHFKETKEDALRRELKEELGIDLKEFIYLFTFYSYFIFPQHIFYARLTSNKLVLEKGETAQWASYKEIKDLPFALQLEKVLGRFFKDRLSKNI